jgi:hypothetical protein
MAEQFVDLTIDEPGDPATIGWALYLHRAMLDGDSRDLLADLARQRGTATPQPGQERGADSVVRTGQAPGADSPVLAGRAPGVDSPLPAGQVAAARFAAVRLLHAHGLCEPAEREAMAAVHQWAPHHDEAPDLTCAYLVEVLAVLDGCGRIRTAVALLNAYGALLPGEGAGAAALAGHVERRLGIQSEIHRHRDICTRRGRRPRSDDEIREMVLRGVIR